MAGAAAANLLVSRVGGVAATVARLDLVHPAQFLEDGLQAPETAAAECGNLAGSWPCSPSTDRRAWGLLLSRSAVSGEPASFMIEPPPRCILTPASPRVVLPSGKENLVQESFVVFDFVRVLVLLGASVSSPTHDLVSLLRAEDYFKASNIAVKPEQMVALALKEPSDGKTQIQQLLALRWLGENPAAAKKTAGARAALEDIAAGKKAADPQGFARLYARQALARLEGKPLPVATAAAGNLREALAWFPTDATILAAADVRPPSATFSGVADPPRPALSNGGPYAPRSQGTVQDRRGPRQRRPPPPPGRGRSPGCQWRPRLPCGALHRGRRPQAPGRLLRQDAAPMATVKESKEPEGESILLLTGGPAALYPAFAFIGRSDLVLVAPLPSGNKKDLATVVQRFLEVRAGKQRELVLRGR